MVELICDKCHKSYTTKGSLNRHIKLIHKKKLHNYICNECGNKYDYKSTLQRHILSKHGEISDDEKFECSDCGKKYLHKHNLRHHIFLNHTTKEDKNFECHDGETNSFEPNLRPITATHFETVECNDCGRKYSYKTSLLRHIIEKHFENKLDECGGKYQCKGRIRRRISSKHSVQKARIERRAFTCLLCCKLLSSESDLLDHFENVHELEIIKENHSFESEQEFIVWKLDAEKQHRCTYIKRDKYRNTNTNKMTVVFRCNRSGFHTPVQSRKRKLKVQGSKKLNGFCPSKIIVHITGDGIHNVVFTKSHVGHSNDYKQLAHMNYSREEKKIIVDKLASGIPPSKIVADMIRSFSEQKSKDGLDKIDLLNEKDVYNIASSHNMNVKNSNCDNANDVGVDAWVAANKKSVYFYKRQGEVDQSNYGLHRDDFVLVFMKSEQVGTFKRYSSNGILVDGTYGLSKEANFLLHTVVVLDESGEGYPTCFFITNRNDALVFDITFSCIRQKFGVIYTNVFMSDMQISYWNSWVRIMGISPQHYLYCSWHVTRAWRKNYTKVKSSEKKVAVSRKVIKLLRENDVAAFHRLLDEFLNDDDEDLRSFITYFRDTYGSNYKKWAFCYRQYAGIDTNIKLNHFHGIFKYSQSRGLTIAQVQNTLTHLDKFLFRKSRSEIRAKVMNRKRCYNIETLKRDVNETIPYVNSDEKLYEITEIDRNEEDNEEREEPKLYVLEKIKKNCPDCPMSCINCRFCPHQFRCLCSHNAKRNVDAEGVEVIDEVEVIDIGECSRTDMVVPLILEKTIFSESVIVTRDGRMSKEQSTCFNEFENRKRQLMAQFEELINESCNDDYNFEIFRKHFQKMKRAFNSTNSLNIETTSSPETTQSS